jgi:hypothetical protein
VHKLHTTTPGFTGTLDYIFLLDGRSVKPTSLLRLQLVLGPRSVQVTLEEYEMEY